MMTIVVLAFTSILLAGNQSHAEDMAPSMEIKKLRLERVEIIRKGLNYASGFYSEGKGSMRNVGMWQRDLLEAELEATELASERVTILQNAVQGASKQEKIAQARYEEGAASEMDVLEAKAFRLRVEIQLKQALSLPKAK